MNVNNWEILDYNDSKLYLKEDHEILIIDNKINKVNDDILNITKEDYNNNKIIKKTFENKLYEKIYREYLEYLFILLKPFEIFYNELNKKELDKYIL
jgi:hypothetical protein